MADIDISDPVDSVGLAENVSKLYEMLFASTFDASSLAENVGTPVVVTEIGPIYDGVTAAEAVSTPVMALKLYRGTNSVTVSLITIDWSLVETFRSYANNGVPVKGIILIPGSGGPDTFSIKDGSDSGAYLYKGAVSAATVIVYPGSLCKPYIDYSECTLSAGHMVTFVW